MVISPYPLPSNHRSGKSGAQDDDYSTRLSLAEFGGE